MQFLVIQIKIKICNIYKKNAKLKLLKTNKAIWFNKCIILNCVLV